MRLTEFPATIQQTATDPIVPVRIIAPDRIRELASEEAESQLAELLHQVRIRPDVTWYSFSTHGAYVDPPPATALLGHNTLVEVSLPYTLHLPSNVPFKIVPPQSGQRATIVLRKVWTDLAAGSSDAEIYAEDRVLYYGPARPESPSIPQAPELGPWPRFAGTNVEIKKDTHGVFRYTRVMVFFDSDFSAIDGPDSDENVQLARSAAFDHATETATGIANYLLDVYRYVTGEEHLERLRTMTVNRVFLASHNLIREGAGVEGGLTSAVVNRSGREIQRIREILSRGIEPERHVLLMQSSRAALDRGQLVLAVVVAFQALEILLETKLRAAYSRLGLPETEVTEKLRGCRTRDRLTTLCREVASGHSVADDTTFWNTWLKDCSGKRNAVVHKNEAVNHSETERLVALCDECISRLLALPFLA